jgi:hypothetical protein
MNKERLTDRDDIFVIHDFLSADECRRHIDRSEATGYGDAPIMSLGGPVLRKDMRNNERVIIDDPSLAGELWLRLQPHLSAPAGLWTAIGLNERFRFYRYDRGQQFDWHFDGSYERSPLERSQYTFMVYLSGGCAGGATEFDLSTLSHAGEKKSILRVQPEPGKALVFVHHVLHRGAPVADGRKYVLRTDVMIRWTGNT